MLKTAKYLGKNVQNSNVFLNRAHDYVRLLHPRILHLLEKTLMSPRKHEKYLIKLDTGHYVCYIYIYIVL